MGRRRNPPAVSRLEKSAPVLMDGWMLRAPPIAGMVAVPAIVSRTWKLPLASVTMPPTRWCSCARVAGPSTTSRLLSRPCPDRSAGYAAGSGPIAGTVWPSIWTVAKSTPVVAATSRSGQQRAAHRRTAPALDRVEGVAEVPPVQRRMRDQRAQAGAEGEGGADHRHGQHRPARTERTGTAVRPARLQGQPQPLRARDRHPAATAVLTAGLGRRPVAAARRCGTWR